MANMAETPNDFTMDGSSKQTARNRNKHGNIVNAADLEWETQAHNPKFPFERKALGAAEGGG